ncbi:UDP binding domain-containing protein [Streptomyces sp. NPDC051954]|uniref:UDP binding domain-containing protein n=1 Tax=unclassified Streptomyces TaxID=2593676 RepID=UPI003438C49C
MLFKRGCVTTRETPPSRRRTRRRPGQSRPGKQITLWGAACKPNTDDIRDSTALAVAQKLHELGAEVTVTDPQVPDSACKAHSELDYADDPIAAVQDADMLLYLTELPRFSTSAGTAVATCAGSPGVIDGRGTLNAGTWRDGGWTVHVLGRP